MVRFRRAKARLKGGRWGSRFMSGLGAPEGGEAGQSLLLASEKCMDVLSPLLVGVGSFRYLEKRSFLRLSQEGE